MGHSLNKTNHRLATCIYINVYLIFYMSPSIENSNPHFQYAKCVVLGGGAREGEVRAVQ